MLKFVRKVGERKMMLNIMGGGYGMGGYGSAAGWMIFGILSWFVLVAGTVLLIKWLWEGGKAYKGETAVEILKKRYARGEISKEEFEEKKKELA